MKDGAVTILQSTTDNRLTGRERGLAESSRRPLEGQGIRRECVSARLEAIFSAPERRLPLRIFSANEAYVASNT